MNRYKESDKFGQQVGSPILLNLHSREKATWYWAEKEYKKLEAGGGGGEIGGGDQAIKIKPMDSREPETRLSTMVCI